MGLQKETVAEFTRLARALYISMDTIGEFTAKATPGQLSAVVEMLEHEQSVRAARKLERLYRKAGLPAIKSFEGYDFSQVSLPEGYGADDLRSLSFVDKAQDFVFYGQTGRGKTHLAIAIAVACVEDFREARFFTVAQLVLALKRANERGELDRMLQDLGQASLIVLDELGYVPIDIEGARLLFQVMSDCYEKRSMVITTNIEFSKWGTVFGDDKMASAIIDRIVHHGRLVEFNGASHRMDAALMLGREQD